MNATLAQLEKGRLKNEGAGGFLNPPGHPEHKWSIETDLRLRPENRGSMSLSHALECEWLDAGTKYAARRKLNEWQRPPLDSPEVVEWIRSVLGYFKGCYKGQDANGEESWNCSDLRIMKDADPVLNQDIHAGVNLIRKYYPEFTATAEDFQKAKWGK